jgi:TonB-dependent receptor
MAELNFGRMLKIIPGVRYEHNQTSYTGIRGDGTASRGFDFYVHKDTTTVRKNDFWLLMLHVRLKPLNWFDVRFAYTNTLSRPSYNQIIPAWDIRLNSVAWKNFQLKPSHSSNFDLYFSAYANKIGLLTVGGFYKQIDDLIFGTGRRAILDPSEYGLPDTERGKAISTQINNKFTVDLWGIETDWQTHFWYLPGILSGLVLNANYTHIFSEAQYPRTIIVTQYLNEPPWITQTNIDTSYANRLINQPDDIVNLSIGYDFKGFSARLSMLFQSNIFNS